ncbi:S-adenosyl-L-methionine-dependent methyltransferase [Byssothecium circinans]|uniref:Mitochondrial transcription factor 1 n=1 Tax=Byssothecium circinans TaxID=147558 RepID=A0A6A5TVD8_9PLEO|nr:S-adenosyl-L-methionine-dependent methyltransferase [Byssothecium circinans]
MSCRPRLINLGLTCRPLGVRYASKGFRRSWDNEKLATTPKYPLSTTLAANIGRGGIAKSMAADPLYSTRSHTYLRTQIVSPDLCDDVIEYIRPSLEKYKGCDIIDLNPGVGVWSQKLHDFLQPRTHILVEPSEAFDPLLMPLVEKSNSTYKFFRGNVGRHEEVERLIQSGLLPHQQRVSRGDKNAYKLNESLLVTGTLGWEPRLPGLGFDSMMKQLLVHWGAKAWTHDGYHAWGPVRSLFWGSSEEIRTCIPRAASHHTKYSFFMDLLSKNTEVVTGDHVARTAGRAATGGREPQHEIQSIVRAMQRGRKNGKELPAHRRENVHDFAQEIERLTDGTGTMSLIEILDYLREKEMAGVSTVGINTGSSIQMVEAEKDFENNRSKYMEIRSRSNSRTNEEKEFYTKEGKRFALQQASTKRAQLRKIELEGLAKLAEEIYDLECWVAGMQDGSGKDSELAKLREKEEDFEHRKAKINLNYLTALASETDDRLILRSPVERLQWDLRPYEPLVMRNDEVWPQNRFSLIDCTPRAPPPDADADWSEWIQDFISGLLSSPTQSVPQSLEKCQPGASALVDKVPSLRDPKKGGRPNLNHMRTRMLTIEMVHELCRAYREWPFKSADANHAQYFRMRMGRSSGKQ